MLSGDARCQHGKEKQRSTLSTLQHPRLAKALHRRLAQALLQRPIEAIGLPTKRKGVSFAGNTPHTTP